MPKIFVNGQFYFNLSLKTWLRVFGTQCRCQCHDILHRQISRKRYNYI